MTQVSDIPYRKIFRYSNRDNTNDPYVEDYYSAAQEALGVDSPACVKFGVMIHRAVARTPLMSVDTYTLQRFADAVLLFEHWEGDNWGACKGGTDLYNLEPDSFSECFNSNFTFSTVNKLIGFFLPDSNTTSPHIHDMLDRLDFARHDPPAYLASRKLSMEQSRWKRWPSMYVPSVKETVLGATHPRTHDVSWVRIEPS